VEALLGYGEGRWHPEDPSLGIPLGEVDRVLVMGSTGLLRAFQEALRGPLGRVLSRAAALGTVGSPMQCMLKGVCAQCLQWQVDPDTGERTRAVFACAEQDQPLLWIDLDNLSARQAQNRLTDHITALWLEALLCRTP
ncbi:MAG: pyridine nucleotide-disulfide oxidoreductase, partial [Gammaproteobacteria bacterium]